MVSSLCPGFTQNKTPHASPSRKLYIGPAKDYSKPLKVDTSVEYDLPKHIYPPKGAAPILMIYPGFVSAVPRARSRSVIMPKPTAMVTTSGATRPLHQQQAPLTNSSYKTASRSSRFWCPCGNPNCNSSDVKSASVQKVRNVRNVPNSQSVISRDVIVIDSSNMNSAVVLQNPQQERTNTVIVAPPHLDRNSEVRLQQPLTATGGTSTTASTTNTTHQLVWGAGGRCRGACCNTRPAAIAPPQAEFVAPRLPSSLLARTPTRGTAGGSPKIKGARSLRGLSVTSSAHLPEYMTMSTSRSARVSGGTTSSQSRVPSIPSMGAVLVATPAPPMAHQNMTTSLTTSLEARAHNLTPKPFFISQQHLQVPQPNVMDLTASMDTSLASSMVPSSISNDISSTMSLLAKVIDLSRDSGISTGADSPLDWTSDRTRGLVDSGFCTPVNIPVSADYATDTLSLPSWMESPTSYTPVIGSFPTSSLLSGASSRHHYLPQPLWNLVY